jgi:hypothetical protein
MQFRLPRSKGRYASGFIAWACGFGCVGALGRKRWGRKRFGEGNSRGERKRMGWATQRSWEVRG